MKRLELTKGQYALVDDEDFAELNRHAWSASFAKATGSYYAQRKEKGKMIMLQRQVMKVKGSGRRRRVDFINGDTLDCQKQNLRLCTPKQDAGNARLRKTNTTGFRGVIAPSGRHRWRANITIKGKSVKLGSFDSAQDAAKAYDVAAKKHFREFARLNFPMEDGNE